jgi:hypothetical protein
VDTAGRIWEGDSVQLATKEVSLTLIPWMRRAGRIPRQRSDWRVNRTAGVVSVTAILRQRLGYTRLTHMYRIVLACKGVPADFGAVAARDIAEEFTHRPWHQNVHCEWDGS